MIHRRNRSNCGAVPKVMNAETPTIRKVLNWKLLYGSSRNFARRNATKIDAETPTIAAQKRQQKTARRNANTPRPAWLSGEVTESPQVVALQVVNTIKYQVGGRPPVDKSPPHRTSVLWTARRCAAGPGLTHRHHRLMRKGSKAPAKSGRQERGLTVAPVLRKVVRRGSNANGERVGTVGVAGRQQEDNDETPPGKVIRVVSHALGGGLLTAIEICGFEGINVSLCASVLNRAPG